MTYNTRYYNNAFITYLTFVMLKLLGTFNGILDLKLLAFFVSIDLFFVLLVVLNFFRFFDKIGPASDSVSVEYGGSCFDFQFLMTDKRSEITQIHVRWKLNASYSYIWVTAIVTMREANFNIIQSVPINFRVNILIN
jgi:hypothetical protein